VNLASFGDGNVEGILSVDISDWETSGIVYGKTAMRCSAQEIETEVWAQIKANVNVLGANVISDENLLTWFLDPDVQFPNPTTVTNLEPLMINAADRCNIGLTLLPTRTPRAWKRQTKQHAAPLIRFLSGPGPPDYTSGMTTG
jgi:hypothetical protein